MTLACEEGGEGRAAAEQEGEPGPGDGQENRERLGKQNAGLKGRPAGERQPTT